MSTTEYITGVLDCKNKTIFGINKNSNVPLIVFKPYDHSLSKFLIPSKLKYTNKNYYAVIKFSRNDPKYRFPIGNLIYSIGEVGDQKAHYEFLLHCHKLNLKEPKLNNISKSKIKKLKKITNIWDIISKDDVKDYKDCRKLKVFSIDPSDSKDIDDAISFHNNLIGIHIADVSFWLDKFNVQPTFFSTIYAPHRKINMIPSFLADNIASLVEGKDRLSLTFWYNVQNNTYHFEKIIIKNNKNYTYDNFPTNHKLYELSKTIGNQYNMNTTEWDTHKMIEVFMILANNKTAEYLSLQDKHIYRVHTRKEHDIPIHNIKNEQFRKFMNIYLSNSAEYTTEKGKHYGLNLDLYTHFTSPIRRMSDVFVHRLIKDSDEFKMDIDKCNDDLKKTKRLKRDFERYEVICNLTNTIQTQGYVVNYFNGKVTVYFPELDFCDKFNIVPFHLKDNEDIFWKQHAKITQLKELNVTIAKKGNRLVYNF